MGIARGWGEASGALLFNGYGVLVWDDGEVLGWIVAMVAQNCERT